ncbi:Ferredoxin subunit of nitrite reductase or a ring-hydroxylating dioxygenase [Quadrisphaera granulorum]|uniref:Nitrite reductase/ring-hydroxylating ferredoxin subunit n=1 Tax=Quadrisphaera granulorum TaxID=317664 RepID=A0A316AEP7_9ACTN|nr:Rieske (2Fe-2S) protein [Quadrisphaera granulorum]PWJ56203.1 nitrite reductase/ring-hydroxylating ferredoxin subunit [Quadrisphaera granulorum]SZE94837.1 Ferredoxin subunit of nitrite reductase or a ring-hydroxylating dioxygenase [Quadrisphaera granulorum]
MAEHPVDTRPRPSAVAPRPLLLRILDAPVHWAWLDPLARPVCDVVHRRIPRGLADVLHGTPIGHPLHPILAQVVVGSWTSAALLDALTLAGLVPNELEDGAESAATTLAATGLASSLPTIAAGWTDWSDLHEDQQRVGLVHAAGNYAATAMVALSLVQRWRGRRTSGRLWSLAAVTTATAGAALGGHLAYRWAAGASHVEHVPHVAPEGWYPVATWDELTVDAPARASVGDVAVVVVRTTTGISVLADTCSHLAASLAGGTVVRERSEECLVCPWHGSTFRLSDGSAVHGPATAPQPVLASRVEPDGTVLARVVELPGVSGSPSTAARAG